MRIGGHVVGVRRGSASLCPRPQRIGCLLQCAVAPGQYKAVAVTDWRRRWSDHVDVEKLWRPGLVTRVYFVEFIGGACRNVGQHQDVADGVEHWDPITVPSISETRVHAPVV